MTARNASKQCTVYVTWTNTQTYLANFGTGLRTYPKVHHRTPLQIGFEDGADLCRQVSRLVHHDHWGGVLASFPEGHDFWQTGAALQLIRGFGTLYSEYPHVITLAQFKGNVDVWCSQYIEHELYWNDIRARNKEVRMDFDLLVAEKVPLGYDDFTEAWRPMVPDQIHA